MLRSSDIKRQARELGFTHIGVAQAGILEGEIARFDEWCARGYDATMGWMRKRRDERRDISLILPGARSVIVVGVNYAPPDGTPTVAGNMLISKYARGLDYHEVIEKRLEELLSWIKSVEPGADGKTYVDTGPILEKAWAVRAGIGWQGKHTNVITQDMGSLVFLGTLVTTLDLEPDSPAVDRCGTCTRCIDACPTQALVAPYVLDAGRCISYLTIEHRGDLPGDLVEGCGEWVFGCDVCQDVCPWNIRFTLPSDDPAWEPTTGLERETPESLESMTREEFAARFKHSAIRRARWEGFLRNVRNALGNLLKKRMTL
jgi:epoxyqueuosine reductase